MEAMALLDELRRCERYQTAPAWQKPFIEPARFLRNQIAKRAAPPAGAVRQANAFHYPGFSIVNGEIVSEQLAFYGYFEADLTEAIIRVIRPGETVIDVGMHLGYYTSLMATLVGEKGAVHSFEPTPSTRELAQRNVGRFKQVTVHPFAMWSEATRMAFKDYGLKWLAFNSFTSARLEEDPVKPREFEVNTTTLDAFRESIPGPVSFIKIDAESAERAILRGAKKMLTGDEPIVSVELGDFGSGNESAGLLDDLKQLGFSPWEVKEGKFIPHTPQSTYDYCNVLFATTKQAQRLQPR